MFDLLIFIFHSLYDCTHNGDEPPKDYNKSKHVARIVRKYNKYRCVRRSILDFIIYSRIETFKTVVMKSKAYLHNSVSNSQQVPEFRRLSMSPSSGFSYLYTRYCISEGLILQEAIYHS